MGSAAGRDTRQGRDPPLRRYFLTTEPHLALLRRVYTGAAVFAAVVAVGSTGYWVLGQGRWAYADCLYMTMITLSTVGFGETLHGMDGVAGARMWTVAQILLGSGSLIFFVSNFTALIVEGDLRGVFRRNQMNHAIAKLRDHVIVCGSGATGQHVIAELLSTGTAFVVIDQSAATIERAAEEVKSPLLHLIGDATDDDVLIRAGIAHAKGLITVLTDDRDNLMVTITARALNERLRIVAKAVLQESRSKLTRAGATSVVSPARIGGTRMVSEIVRPTVVAFLDALLRDSDPNRRIEEIHVAADSALVGKRLADLVPERTAEWQWIAVKQADGAYLFNPGAEHRLVGGTTLLVVVPIGHLTDLRGLFGTNRGPR